MTNSRAVVRRKLLARGGPAKALMMFNNRALFGPIFRYFDWVRSDAVTAGELDRYLKYLLELRSEGRPAPASYGGAGFLGRLLREKVRSWVPGWGREKLP